MVKAKQWLLSNKPSDMPVIEGSDATFKLSETDLPEPKDGEILVKPIYLSNDPAQRGWISPDADPDRLYVSPVKQGQVMMARGLAEVVESKSDKYGEGEIVLASTGWSEYAVVKAEACQPAPELPNGLSRTLYLGSFGLTGLTAYFGLTEVAQIKKDDIVVVSGAAGATGNMCVQIAKNIVGCKKVIGIAGSDDKCKWVESLGADVCLNYKKSSFADDFRKLADGPDNFVNAYFDNVGGDILDLVLTRMARYGRVAACGAIANYNASGDRTIGIKNWFEVIQMRLQIKGFIVLDYMTKFGEAIDIFKKGLQDGKIKVEGGEHIVKPKNGFEGIPATWTQLFEGANTGKLITDLTA